MDWFRMYNGTTCDAKWLPIARFVGCPAGVVSNVWTSLLEHANQQRPRGSIGGWDAEAYVEFSGFRADWVDGIYARFEAKGLIADGRLRAWAKRNGEKQDATATARKKRERERKKAEKLAGVVTPCHAVTGDLSTGHASSRSVTPQERESVALERYALAPSSTSSDISKSKSAEHAQALSEQEVMQQLDQGGHAGSVLRRAFNGPTVRRWVAQGVTAEQLASAIELGKAKRAKAGSTQALNVGFLDPILGDVMAGAAPPRPSSRPVVGASPPRDEDPLANAIAYARQVHRLDADDSALERRIAEARAKFGRGVAA